MYYIKLATKEFPKHIGDIWLEYPELIGKFTCPETYAQVQQTPPPEHNKQTQVAQLDTPIEENGVWKMTWKIHTYTQEELDSIEALKNDINNNM